MNQWDVHDGPDLDGTRAPALMLAGLDAPAGEWRFVGLAVALTGACFALIWYQAYGLNQAIQLAYVNHWLDPGLYRRDPFLSTAPYYTTLLWPAVAALARVIPLKGLLLGGMILERFVSIYAAGRVARSLIGASVLGRLAAMVIMTVGPLPLLGSGTTMPDYFEQSGLAIAVLLVSFECLQHRRYLLWGALVGLAANLNALYAAYAALYAAAIFFAQRRPIARLQRVALALLPMVGFAAPLLVLLSRLPRQRAFDRRLWWRAMMFRSAHHLLPLSWPAGRFAGFGFSVLLLLTIGVFAGRRRARLAESLQLPALPELAGFAVGVAVVSAGALLAAFLVAYVVQVPRLLILQPIRATDLGYCLGDIVFAAYAACWFDRAGGLSVARSVGLFAIVLVACFWPLLPVGALLITLGCGVAVFGLGSGTFIKTPAARQRWATGACLAAVGVAAIARPALTWRYTMFNLGNRWPASAVAAWAARTTPVSAVFLVDAVDDRTEPFRALSRRAVFVHVKDGTALFVDPAYLSTWRDRMRLAGYPLPHQHASGPRYPHWQDTDALRLHERSGVDYWLVTPEWPTRLPVVWEDRNFKVLALDGVQGR